jgi:hypothetical protein
MGSAPIADTIYNNGRQVASLSLRVDMVAVCSPSPCAFNVTSGYAVILQSLGPSFQTSVRNITYKPLAFASGASVNLYMQAFNATQIVTSMGTPFCTYLAGPPQRLFNYTVAGQFGLNITGGSRQFAQRTVSFTWAGLQLGQTGTMCSNPPAGGPLPYSTQLLYYKFLGFGPAYIRLRP